MSRVANKFKDYSPEVRQRLEQIRRLIFSVAREEGIGEITETLKWGEPSYASKKGSPIRIDWKPKYPQQVSVYFNCNSKLVDTFREVYPGVFTFVGNREIALSLSEPLPVHELRACLSMALRYHSIKHLPLLGA